MQHGTYAFWWFNNIIYWIKCIFSLLVSSFLTVTWSQWLRFGAHHNFVPRASISWPREKCEWLWDNPFLNWFWLVEYVNVYWAAQIISLCSLGDDFPRAEREAESAIQQRFHPRKLIVLGATCQLARLNSRACSKSFHGFIHITSSSKQEIFIGGRYHQKYVGSETN